MQPIIKHNVTIQVGPYHIVRPPHHIGNVVQVQQACTRHYGITNDVFMSHIKPQHVSDCRTCFCWIMSRIYGWTYLGIGQYLNGRHHTTIRTRCLCMDVWIEREYPIANDLYQILKNLCLIPK